MAILNRKSDLNFATIFSGSLELLVFVVGSMLLWQVTLLAAVTAWNRIYKTGHLAKKTLIWVGKIN